MLSITRVPVVNNPFLSVKSVFENCLKSNSIAFVGAALISLALTGCGGGGGSKSAASAPLTAFTGTAAVGTAIPGALVSGLCVTGTPSTTTDTNGKYTLQLAGLTLPCILSVPTGLTDPVLGTTTTLYSVVYSGQATANITPITQLILSNALGSNYDPSSATPTQPAIANKLTSANIANATAIVTTALTTAGITIPSNPLTSAFTAATNSTSGDASDISIDLFMNSIRQAQITTPATTLTSLSTGFKTATSASVSNYINSIPLVSKYSPGKSAQMTVVLSHYSYDMESLPIVGGTITTLTSTNIGYDSGNAGYVNLIGNFTFSGDSLDSFNACSQNPSSCIATNLPGVSGTVTEIHQADTNKNQFMVIQNLNINEATLEGLIPQLGSQYKIWQLIVESNSGLTVINNRLPISCPTPSNGGNAATITSGGQSIEQQFINKCLP